MHIVAAAVCIHEQRVLVAQRPPGKHLAGVWEFPGGKLHAGETPIEALRRELREELAVDLVAAEPWRFVYHQYPEHTVLLLFFRCRIQGEPKPQEENVCTWVTAAELAALDLPPADEPLLEPLYRLLSKRPADLPVPDSIRIIEESK